MEKQISFVKAEHDVRPGFRRDLSIAESTEDVKKFFVYAAKGLVEKAFEGKVSLENGDIRLDPGQKDGFVASGRLLGNQDFLEAWNNSDLRPILKRMASAAAKRYLHLEKHSEKTESKIFHNR